MSNPVNVPALAKALEITTDNMVSNRNEQSISDDLIAIFNSADRLPQVQKKQFRTAVKGILLAINQEMLDSEAMA